MPMPRILIVSLALGLVGLVGCGGGQEATVYTVPKENPTAPAPATPPAAAPVAPLASGANPNSMAGRSLPDDVLNRGAIAPAWEVPAHWVTLPLTSVRIGSFRVDGPEGPADVAVTSFPGDVGGFLANVNRWRQQISLAPVTQSEATAASETLATASGPATLVAFGNGTTDTLAAIHMHDNASWFFKMTGPSALVARETANFRAWVASIDFAATHGH